MHELVLSSHTQTTQLQESHKPKLIIVSGYSGAGKHTVLRTLEDIGFFCVDNLPIALLASFVQLIVQAKIPGRIALGIDIRGERNIQSIVYEIYRLRETNILSIQVIFVLSSMATLFKRFQETRRKHPLTEYADLAVAIEQEQQLLRPLKDSADLLVDTDTFTVHHLRNLIRLSFQADAERKIAVTVTSFGFKYGVPLESSLVFDVRFLPNPYFIPALKLKSGEDEEVHKYLFSQTAVLEYWQILYAFVTYTIKKAHEEGRFMLHIAIGCTGGRHRSVALVQKLAQEQIPDVYWLVKHRDIHKDEGER